MSDPSRSGAVPDVSGFSPSRQLKVDDYDYKALSQGRTRIIIGILCFLGAFGLVLARLAEVSLTQDLRPSSLIVENDVPQRVDITDRNGELLATTLGTYSLYADPRKVWDVEETTEGLISVLPDLDREIVEARLSGDKEFVWIKRNLTPRDRQAVFALGLPGLGFRVEPRRVYPRGNLASHILGWTDVDMNGAAGAERAFNDELSLADGAPKKLSIDMRIQYALHDELSKSVEKFNALGGAGVVLDVQTGEILAMVSLPDFDPNRYSTAQPQNRLNRATMATYELGSTYKPITMAMALEHGIDPARKWPVNKPLRLRGFNINDDHPVDYPLPMFDVLSESSNKGSSLMALEVGEPGHQDFLRKLGLFDRVPIELAESARPQLPREWQDLTTATASYGHGIAVTPLALATALAPLVNGGEYVTPTLEYRSLGQEQPRRRVMSAQTSQTMRDMMRYVVVSGTGRNADVPGYGVMGKTGTAEKPGVGGYQERNLVTSFVAAFPHSDPKYLVFIMLDEPKAIEGTYGYATAGWNAAPTAGNVVERMVTLLGLPSEPSYVQAVDASASGVRP